MVTPFDRQAQAERALADAEALAAHPAPRHAAPDHAAAAQGMLDLARPGPEAYAKKHRTALPGEPPIEVPRRKRKGPAQALGQDVDRVLLSVPRLRLQAPVRLLGPRRRL